MSPALPIPAPGPGYIGRALLTLTRKPSTLMPPLSQRFTGQLRAAHVADYRRVMGFEAAQAVVPLSYHYIAIQRAQVAMMLGRGFPFPVAGMVHLANRMDQLRPFELAGEYELVLGVEEEPQPEGGADKGRFVRFVAEVAQGGQTCVRCESRYLAQRARRKPGGPRKPKDTTPATSLQWPALDSWTLDAGSGLQYARLSGDYNPIHLWGWSARLLGFKRPIIQGMHTVGRAEAALERHLQRSARHIAATFRAPIALGARPTLRTNGAQWAVTNGTDECVAGETS